MNAEPNAEGTHYAEHGACAHCGLLIQRSVLVYGGEPPAPIGPWRHTETFTATCSPHDVERFEAARERAS